MQVVYPRAARLRFGYYRKLTATQKATYRQSDAVAAIPLPDAARMQPLVKELEAALATGKRLATAKAASALVLALSKQLGVPAVGVTVRTVRPEIRGGELHGLYRFGDEEKTPTIDVWMKTAAHERVVRFRTFLRTLLHEVVHHLDVTLLRLPDSFHTEGFYRRESSLMRQLAPKPVRAKPEEPKRGKQLGLFD
jgi:hypothetical protein